MILKTDTLDIISIITIHNFAPQTLKTVPYCFVGVVMRLKVDKKSFLHNNFEYGQTLLQQFFALVIIFENINFDNISFVPKQYSKQFLLSLIFIYNFSTAEKYVQFIIFLTTLVKQQVTVQILMITSRFSLVIKLIYITALYLYDTINSRAYSTIFTNLLCTVVILANTIPLEMLLSLKRNKSLKQVTRARPPIKIPMEQFSASVQQNVSYITYVQNILYFNN